MNINWQNMDVPLCTSIEKALWLSIKEKVPSTAVSKEGHADSHLGHERTHHY